MATHSSGKYLLKLSKSSKMRYPQVSLRKSADPQVSLRKSVDPQVPRTRSAVIPAGTPFKRCGLQFHSLSCKEAHARGNFYD